MDRMEELVRELNRLCYHYYVLDEPVVSDKEYDVLYDELVALEKNTGVVLSDSPTRRVGGETIKSFRQVKHTGRLYSLDKSQTVEGLRSFYDKIEKAFGSVEVTLEYKFDGLTINLTYENGEFVRAATRGTGVVGEDVTAQVMTIHSFPYKIDYPGKIEIQGEGIMRKSVLAEYNKTAAEPLKNARNGVAGAIRNLDPKITAERKLDIMFYNIGYCDTELVHSQTECMEFLRRNKFKVSDFFRVCNSFEELENGVKEIGESRDSLDFLIDGAVLKVNSFAVREELGYTEKFPKWAIAYKFEAEEVSTLLLDAVWQVGRTGKLTPLALLEPVDFSGVTVKRATLNNLDDIARKGVKIGSRVLVRRSNDVIPEVLGVTEYYETDREITAPEVCPACGAKVFREGVNLYCPNFDDCPPQIVARMAHFASKDAMDIEGFSEKTAEQLYESMGITSVHQLYELTRDDLLKLEGFQEKKADNLLNAVEQSKRAELSSFLFGLGILNVGKKTAKELAERFGSFEAVASATPEQLVAIPDVGEIVANSILRFFAEEENRAAIQKLFDNGVVCETAAEKKQGAFSGQRVVLTGSMQSYSRSEAGKLIEDAGGELDANVTSSTTLVIAGEKAGSKLEKAVKKGIRVITEQQFLEMLG